MQTGYLKDNRGQKMDKSKYDYFSTNNKVYMVIIAILIAIIFIFGKLLIGIIASVLYGILIMYNTKKSKLKKYEWKRFIEEFSSKLDVATKNTLVKLPFPLIIIDDKGKILVQHGWFRLSRTDWFHGPFYRPQKGSVKGKFFSPLLTFQARKNRVSLQSCWVNFTIK